MPWLKPLSTLLSPPSSPLLVSISLPLNRTNNRKRLAIAALASTLIGAGSFTASSTIADDAWPNWRGPLSNGSAANAKPPTDWGIDKNIEWKVELPGLGSSTPIVWGNQVIVHSSVAKPQSSKEPGSESSVDNAGANKEISNPNDTNDAVARPGDSSERRPRGPGFGPGNGPGGGFGGPGGPGRGRLAAAKPTEIHQFLVTSYNLKTGDKNWETVVKEEVPHEGGHSTNNFASSSPVTDGNYIYSFFGSRGIFCLDMDGKKLWEADLGDQTTRNEFGEGSSAALYKNYLIIQWDHEGESFLAALDAASGDLKWKTIRKERTTWCTPVIAEHNGRAQVITNGRKIRSYDLETGTLIWEAGKLTENPIPTPILYKDFVIATTGFRGAACYAISLDAHGDLDEDSEYIKWTYHHNTPYVPSPVLYKDQLYFLSENKAILTCVDANTGDAIFARSRLNGVDTIYSSIGAADDKIFVTGRNGTTVVLKAGADKEVLATNELGEQIDASPVFVGDRLLLRSDKHLYSLRDKP